MKKRGPIERASISTTGPGASGQIGDGERRLAHALLAQWALQDLVADRQSRAGEDHDESR